MRLPTAAKSDFAALAGPALAATQPASGSFTEGPETITSAKCADDNEIYTLTREAVFSGSYTGVGQADQRIVIYKDCSAQANMTIEFVGSACGEPLMLTFRVTASVHFATNMMSGHYVVKDEDVGGDAIGQGTFTGVPGTGGAYEGAIHCD